jgi:hypothetical protein
MATERYDDEDDYLPPPPNKSGPIAMLILGIILGASVLLVLLLVVCGGMWFMRAQPVAPDEHQHWQAEPARHENGVMDKGGPAAKPATSKEREPEMKAKHGPPAGSDK